VQLSQHLSLDQAKLLTQDLVEPPILESQQSGDMVGGRHLHRLPDTQFDTTVPIQRHFDRSIPSDSDDYILSWV
jgi:hypothetical protein